MKNVLPYMMIMTFGIFVTFNAALAAERVKVFELAESGQRIEFPAARARPELQPQDTALARGNPEDRGARSR